MNFTIEESTTEEISPILHEIIKEIRSHGSYSDSLQKEYMFVLIIVLMLENGFLPLKNDTDTIEEVKSIDSKQLAKWKSRTGVIEAMFVLRGFESLPLKLILSPLGTSAIVNLVIKDLDSDTYSVCLPMSRYIVSPQASTIPMMFRDLKHLSITFNNKILTAVKSRLLSHCGYPSASLLGLPEEVYYKIFLCLSIIDLVRLSQTCNKFKLLMENESLWHKLYKRDFKHGTERIDWKILYQEEYLKRKEEQRRQERQSTDLMPINWTGLPRLYFRSSFMVD